MFDDIFDKDDESDKESELPDDTIEVPKSLIDAMKDNIKQKEELYKQAIEELTKQERHIKQLEKLLEKKGKI